MRRAIAIDWSGRLVRPEAAIWLAEADETGLVRLEAGRDREATRDHVRALGDADPSLVIGIDFAFSMPAWFVRAHGGSARALWETATREGEAWLATCPTPFWGKPGKPRPIPMTEATRVTDRLGAARTRPKSPFQIGGSGSVGTGSIRGMPVLAALADAGFSMWPFLDGPGPRVVEIYPRLFTGPVVKSDPSARRRAVEAERRIPRRLARHAIASDDAFDAALSALGMLDGFDAIRDASYDVPPDVALEGFIAGAGEVPGA